MSILTETFTLANGVTIPKVGFGTWQMPEGAQTQGAVEKALELGYRHVDTANAYGNEASVGRAVRAAMKDLGLAREDVFVTSKLPAAVKDHDGAAATVDESLTNLGLDHMDLYLIHAPWPWSTPDQSDDAGNLAAWSALEEALAAGKIRAIGISNFAVHDMQNILDHADVAPAVNQILSYVGFTQPENTAFAQKHGMVVEAYSPLATGGLLRDPVLARVASAHGVTPAQVAIRFCIDRGVLPLPKATSEDHIRANAQLDFQLTEDEIRTLAALPDADPSHYHVDSQR
jgi:diketogulonate reductase-like aldo/keto reductase